jgi:hypothetical protein
VFVNNSNASLNNRQMIDLHGLHVVEGLRILTLAIRWLQRHAGI